MNRQRTQRGGFSLLEVLMVIVIMGVLAAVVAPGLGALDRQREDSAFAEISRTLRYARASAMATGAPTGVRLRTDSGVRLDLLQIDLDTSALEAAPGPLGEDAPTRYLDREIPSLVIVSMTNGDGATSDDETFWFRFDGTPHTRTGAGAFDSLYTENAIIELQSGSTTRSIRVLEHSGVIDEL